MPKIDDDDYDDDDDDDDDYDVFSSSQRILDAIGTRRIGGAIDYDDNCDDDDDDGDDDNSDDDANTAVLATACYEESRAL